MMLDHVSLTVDDYDASKAFYTAVLPSINSEYKLIMEFTNVERPEGTKSSGGFGTPTEPAFWITTCPKGDKAQSTHIAFSCKTREQVDAFHKAALEAGAKSEGEPGLRPEYHPNYYGAFVTDPSGHNVEAVCHFDRA